MLVRRYSYHNSNRLSGRAASYFFMVGKI